MDLFNINTVIMFDDIGKIMNCSREIIIILLEYPVYILPFIPEQDYDK
jgi:hypothetical protein